MKTINIKQLFKRKGSYNYSLVLYLNYLIICFLLSITPSFSQTDSLTNYLTIAAENNSAVLRNYYEYQAALQKVPQVGSLQDPQLNSGIFLKPMELIGGNQLAEIQLMQMFPWFGTLRAAKDEMSQMANAKFESLRDSKLQVFFDVHKLWYELYKINKELQVSEKNIEILRTIERLAIIRFGTAPSLNSANSYNSQSMTSERTSGSSQTTSQMQGMGNGSSDNASKPLSGPSGTMQNNNMGSSLQNFGLADLYIIQIEIGELNNYLEFLKNQQKVLTAKFNGTLNRPLSTKVYTPDTLIVDTLGFDVISISDSIRMNNPMLSMLEYEKQSINYRKKMQSRMGYPMLGLGLNYTVIGKNEMSESEMNGEDMIMPMLSFSIPIYRKKYKAMKNESDLLLSSISQRYTETSKSLQVEYYEAVQLYEDSKRRIRLYNDQGSLAKSTLNILMNQFSTSKASLSDILRVYQQVSDYDYKQIEAISDFNTSIAWLKRLGAVNYNNQ